MSYAAEYGSTGGTSVNAAQLGVLADQHTVQAVPATPGWEVVSAFYLSEAFTDPVALQLVLLVSSGSLSVRARLFDVTLNAPVAGSTSPGTSSTTDVVQTSGDLAAAMPAGHIYQLEVECTGGAASSDAGVLRSGKLLKI